MPMILAMNGADFGDFGAAKSQPVADLQTALVALGKGIKDGTLMKVAVDGIMGPKTAAATNRALTVHLGPGQAPANLRTGLLSQALITSQVGTITDLIEAEIARRGFVAPVSKKISTTTTRPKVTPAPAPTPVVTYTPPPVAVAPSPIYRVPAQLPSGGGMDMSSIIKWSAIGVGVVAVAGIMYYLATKKGPAMAGFAGEGERGHPFKLRWFPANQAYGVVWGDQVIDVHGQRFFATKAEAKAALTRAGLKLVGKNTVVSVED